MPSPNFEELEPLPKITLAEAKDIARSAKAARDLLAFEEQQKEVEGVNWNAQRMGLKSEVRDYLYQKLGYAAGTGINAVRTLKRKGGRRSRKSRRRQY